MHVHILEMEMDLEAANAKLGAAHREFEQSNLAMTGMILSIDDICILNLLFRGLREAGR